MKMKFSRKEKVCHLASVSVITICYVILGIALLFGPEEVRLARNWNTISISVAAGVATWVFYSAISFAAFRIIFHVLKPLQSGQTTKQIGSRKVGPAA